MQDEFFLALLYRMVEGGKQYSLHQGTDHDLMAFSQFKWLRDWAQDNPNLSAWFLILFQNGKVVEVHFHEKHLLDKLEKFPK